MRATLRTRRILILQSTDHRRYARSGGISVTKSRALFLFTAGLAVLSAPAVRADPGSWLDTFRDPAARLIGAAITNSVGWQRLALLTDVAGHRLSGSPQLEHAVQW